MTDREATGAQVVDDWFVCREALAGVWQIAEPTHVHTWLVVGQDRAALIDTGMGIRPIRPVAERLSGRPVDVISTHYHFDHVGGHHEFPRIAIHPAGAEKLRAGVPGHLLEDYRRARAASADTFDSLLALDATLGFLGPEARPRLLPADVVRGCWQIPPARADRLLADGESIDLGGRSLRVLHTPGHSPDGVSLFDEHSGVLFVGDTFNLGRVYCHFDDSSIGDLAATARFLADFAQSFSAICTHHHPRVIAEPNLLVDFADLTDRVANGEVPSRDGHDCFGYPVQVASADYFAITMPSCRAPAVRIHSATEPQTEV